MPEILVRPETASDADVIRSVNIEAFRDHPFSQQTEHLIVEALRDACALEMSLVAEVGGRVIGHIAFSLATIGDSSAGWYLLGPVAVLPKYQRQGVGRVLVDAGLARLRSQGASGCALVGDPDFYERFGFRNYPDVTVAGVPDEYVFCLPFATDTPVGELAHHPAFSVKA